MAIGLENFTNIEPADSDYPFGSIRNNPGNNTGTPFSKETYNDIQITMRKIMEEAGITPNGLFDNEYNGYQLFLSMQIAFRRYQKAYVPVGNSTLTIPAYEQAIVYGIPGILPSQIVALPNMNNTCDGHTVRIVNDDTSETISVTADVNIDYATSSPYTVPVNSKREFTLIKSISTWIISDK